MARSQGLQDCGQGTLQAWGTRRAGDGRIMACMGLDRKAGDKRARAGRREGVAKARAQDPGPAGRRRVWRVVASTPLVLQMQPAGRRLSALWMVDFGGVGAREGWLSAWELVRQAAEVLPNGAVESQRGRESERGCRRSQRRGNSPAAAPSFPAWSDACCGAVCLEWHAKVECEWSACMSACVVVVVWQHKLIHGPAVCAAPVPTGISQRCGLAPSLVVCRTGPSPGHAGGRKRWQRLAAIRLVGLG